MTIPVPALGYASLVTLWGTLSGTTLQKLNQINATTLPGPNSDISSDDISGILARSNKMAALDNYARGQIAGSNAAGVQAAVYLLIILRSGGGIPTSDPVGLSILTNLLNSLVSDTAHSGITAGNRTAFLALASTTLPWWLVNGFSGPITVYDLIQAGNLS